jgi:response regulator of citrate/malate metabolism
MSSTEKAALKVMIIGNVVSRAEASVTFLKRRGYESRFCRGLKEAVDILETQEHDYLFISWNITGVDILQAIRLVSRKYNLVCIAYAEDEGIKTSMQMRRAQLPYTLQAPANGTSMHMMIQRIVREQELLRQEAKNSQRKSDALEEVQANKNVIIKTKTVIDASVEDIANVEGEWVEQVSIESTVDSTEEQPVEKDKNWFLASEQETSLKGKKGVFTFKGAKPPEKKGQGWILQKGGNQLKFEVEQSGPDPLEGKRGTITQLSVDSEMKEATAGQGNTQSDKFNLTQEGADALQYSLKEEKTKTKQTSNGVEISASETEATSHKIFEAAKKVPTKKELEEENKREKEALGFTKEDGALVIRKASKSSLLEEGTRLALRESIQVSGEIQEGIKVAELCTTLKIHSTRFNGYLVLTFGANRNLEDKVIFDLQTHLLEFLKKQGEANIECQKYQMQVEPVEFKKWGKSEAEFVLLSDHQGYEIGVAFIESAPPQVNLNPFSDDTMYSIDPNDIRPDSQLNFDLFLYLPLNQKFLKHTVAGNYMTSSRFEKLVDAKKKEYSVLIKKNDADLFKIYVVTQIINAFITKYKSVLNAA